MGVYGTAPFWGRIVDSRGPRILLVIAFVSLLVGYNGMRYLYDRGLSSGATDLTTVSFGALVLFGFLTGIGGNGGLTSAMNSTAKSFPDGLVSNQNLQPCCRILMSPPACYNQWTGDFWLRPLCIPFFLHRARHLPWKYLRVFACTCYRNFTSNGSGLLPPPAHTSSLL